MLATMSLRTPHRLLPLATLVALLAPAPSLAAATVDDLLQEVTQALKPDEIEEPGNPARAQAISALLGEKLGLSPAELLELHTASGEAWLDAGRIAEARAAFQSVLASKEAPTSLRERAALGWIAVWQLEWRQAEKPEGTEAVLATLAPFGDLGPVVLARAHTSPAWAC
jgi:hypothetical protein